MISTAFGPPLDLNDSVNFNTTERAAFFSHNLVAVPAAGQRYRGYKRLTLALPHKTGLGILLLSMKTDGFAMELLAKWMATDVLGQYRNFISASTLSVTEENRSAYDAGLDASLRQLVHEAVGIWRAIWG